MKCPYSKLDLQVALATIDEDKLSEEKMKEFSNKNPDLMEEKITASTIAEFHGIKTEELVNSSNYEKLEEKYRNHLTKELLNRMTKQLDLTDKEAWAIIVMAS